MRPHVARVRLRDGVLLLLLSAAPGASGQTAAHPLQPQDRSSPRAALRTFLDSVDAVMTFAQQEYLPAPTREKFHRLVPMIDSILQSLDLSEVAPVSRMRMGRSAVNSLYETLNRIELPAWDEIPGTEQLEQLAHGDPPQWTIPNTEITLVRVRSGPRGNVFLFSPDTVARSGEFLQRVQGLPYRRPVPLEGWHEKRFQLAGWMIPFRWIEALPPWLRVVHAGQATWKWAALALVLVLFALALVPVYRLSRRVGRERVFLNALARLSLPVFFLAGAAVVSYLAVFQINLLGGAAEAIGFLTTVVLYLAGAWVAWRAASVLAEALVALPHLGSQSIDAHLVRLFTRLGGLAVALLLVVSGANELGIPVYGIIAGLGVGGLAIALAAQPTIENLIGGLNIFADRPIRVGSFCHYGSDQGTVETIGIRSTRMRGLNRTITTIPNAILSKMPIVNYAERDRMLIKCVLNLRYETSREQLQYLLASLRTMLRDHPRIDPDPARVRFVGFGASSLDVEVFAYVTTRDWNEFLAIREDVFLRIMAIVENSGTTFAFPSQTLYVGRDGGVDAAKVQAAEAQLKSWRHDDRLGSLGFWADASVPIPETAAGTRPGRAGSAHGAAKVASEATEQPTPPGAARSV